MASRLRRDPPLEGRALRALEGLPAAPRGVPQIEVTFDIDANGIVKVNAVDKATGKEQAITITASSGLSDADIERMVSEAEKHASEDAERKKSVEARNQADSMAWQTERLLKEHGDKLPAGEKAKVEEAIANLKTAVQTDDANQIEAAMEQLTQASHKLSEILYSQAGGQPGAAPGGAAPGKAEDDDVIDAEFEEKN